MLKLHNFGHPNSYIRPNYYETENKNWHQEINEWVPNTKMTPKCENLYSQETAGLYRRWLVSPFPNYGFQLDFVR